VVTSDQISPAPAATPPTEDIEIELPHGTRIRVGAGVNAAALRVDNDNLASYDMTNKLIRTAFQTQLSENKVDINLRHLRNLRLRLRLLMHAHAAM
jgi:hypothetical protein